MRLMNGDNVDMHKIKSYIDEHFADNPVANKFHQDSLAECKPKSE